YLLKDVLKGDLLSAIHAAVRGEPTLHPEAQRQLMRQMTQPAPKNLLDALTEREMDVLRLIARGQSNKEIAASLHLTEGTVKGYVSTILGKLQVADRTQAALYAVKHGVE
ncbi:MAG: response regulator transcription factor, partial [Anaerolineales bacterium]|nr:response regulator transcription factor [Anaerolineales bacterium]